MRKIIALLLTIFLVFPLIMATLSVISVSSWVLDRGFYEGLLGDERLYEVLLSEELPNYFGRRIVVREIESLPADALSDALREVVTPAYMREQALRIVDDVFDFIEGRDFTLDLYLDIAPIKAALRGEAGPRFSRTLAEGLPTCAAGQEALAPDGTIIRCIPADVSVEEAAGLISLALPVYLDEVPDRIDLNRNPIDLRRELRGAEIWTGFVGTNGLNLAIIVLVFIAGSFWAVAALIGGEDQRERLMWLGWTLLIPAVLIFLIGLPINSDVASNWVRYGFNEARFGGFEYSAEFRQALLDVSRHALNQIANGFMAAGGVAGAIALALLAWGFSTPSEKRMARAMAYPAPPAPSAAPQPTPEPQQPASGNEPPGSSEPNT